MYLKQLWRITVKVGSYSEYQEGIGLWHHIENERVIEESQSIDCSIVEYSWRSQVEVVVELVECLDQITKNQIVESELW